VNDTPGQAGLAAPRQDCDAHRMKTLSPGVIIFICCEGLRMSSFAETPAPPQAAKPDPVAMRQARLQKANWNVRVDVQMVAMPEANALLLLPELRADDDKKVEAAVAAVQEMIKRKEALLIAWPMVVGLDGQRLISETIVEEKYPTEFDPPLVPQNPGGPGPHAEKVSPIPTAFEVRNVGATLEVETSVSAEGKVVFLSLVPQRVGLLRFETHSTGKTKDGGTITVDQPIFASEKTTAALTLRNGQRLLISVHKLEQPAGYLEFFILRAVATKIE
jgi:hypothetical protein